MLYLLGVALTFFLVGYFTCYLMFDFDKKIEHVTGKSARINSDDNLRWTDAEITRMREKHSCVARKRKLSK